MKIQSSLILSAADSLFNTLTTDGANINLKICLLNDVLPSEKELLLATATATQLLEEVTVGTVTRPKYIHSQPAASSGNLIWRGEFTEDPAQATLNDWYFNTTDSITYLYNGTIWEEFSGEEIYNKPLGQLVNTAGELVVFSNAVKLNFFNFEKATGNIGGWCIYNEDSDKIVGLDFINKTDRYVNNSDINISILSLISFAQ